MGLSKSKVVSEPPIFTAYITFKEGIRDILWRKLFNVSHFLAGISITNWAAKKIQRGLNYTVQEGNSD